MALARRPLELRDQLSSTSLGDVANDVVLDATPSSADFADDPFDVPAAVICARCGDAECLGCTSETTKSGIVAIVPWERPGSPFSRLWTTARASTFDAERFFESLPDGALGPALSFALISESLAVGAFALVGLGVAGALVPGWLRHLIFDNRFQGLWLLLVLVPVLASLLVAAHVAHGTALDWGARRAGLRSAWRRSLRFGLYATGWDLVVGPLGALVMAFTDGPRGALRVLGISVGLPTRSALAFLRGAYRIEHEAARGPLNASYVAAALATVGGAVVFIAVGILIWLV